MPTKQIPSTATDDERMVALMKRCEVDGECYVYPVSEKVREYHHAPTMPWWRDGRRTSISIPRWVLQWRLQRPLDEGQREVARHACHRPQCIRPQHLVPGTMADNTRDMVEAGRMPRRGRLPDEAVRDIRARVASGERQWVVAQRHGVDPTLVSRICNRKRYMGVSNAGL